MWTKAPYRAFGYTKLLELRHPIVSKKGMDVMHVGVDLDNYAELSVSIHKEEWMERRGIPRLINDTAKYATRDALAQILQNVMPHKSLALFVDGSIPLYTTRAQRRAKKAYKLAHGPCSELMVKLEENMIESAISQCSKDSNDINEVVVGGTRVPGYVETKMAGWVQDLNARGIPRNDSIVYVGQGQHNFITLMCMVPFHNLAFLSLAMNDSRQFYFYDLAEYLGLLDYIDSPDFSRIRIDIAFIMLAQAGSVGWSQLTAVCQFPFTGALDRYHQSFIPKRKFLFNDKLQMNTKHVIDLLEGQVKTKTPKTSDPPTAIEWIEIMHQTLYSLVTGRILNYYYVPEKYSSTTSQSVDIHALLVALKLEPSLRTPRMDHRPPPAGHLIMLTGIGSEFAAQGTNLPNLIKEVPAESRREAHERMVSMVTADDLMVAYEKAQAFKEYLGDLIPSKLMETRQASVFARPGKGTKLSVFSFGIGALSQSMKGLRYRDLSNYERQWDPAMRKQTKHLVIFDPDESAWVKKGPTFDSVGTTSPDTFSMLTWNILFDRFNNEVTLLGKPAIDRCPRQRYIATAETIRIADVDVVCLQEVMKPFWDYLASLAWVQERYILSTERTGIDIDPWGVMLMVHKRVSIMTTATHNIPGHNGNICPMPEVVIRCKEPVRVSSCHLTSSLNENQRSIRETQLRNFVKLCEPERTGKNMLVCGDFNEDYDIPDKLHMKDVWLETGKTHRDGWTIDNQRNPFCGKMIEDEFQGRYDRIFFRSDSLHVVSAELIGNVPVSQILGEPPLPDGTTWPEWLYCSDHFGIKATFSFHPKS